VTIHAYSCLAEICQRFSEFLHTSETQLSDQPLCLSRSFTPCHVHVEIDPAKQVLGPRHVGKIESERELPEDIVAPNLQTPANASSGPCFGSTAPVSFMVTAKDDITTLSITVIT
jgi:hypothetical protein